MQRLDALMLCGGSAFGLAAADGAMRWCEERGLGHPTSAGPVPIVVALSIFDLPVGDGSVRPTAEDGYLACEMASADPVQTGAVGAGTGARMGFDRTRRGGVGTAGERIDGLVVAALVVVNAAGLPAAEGPADLAGFDPDGVLTEGNTTIGVIVTNARLTKPHCFLVAQGAHDGLARAIDPPHTTVDGDVFVAAATGTVGAPVDLVRALAVRATAAAVVAAPPDGDPVIGRQ
jgi:L-aminopeptidase/D-esterase-like protein